MTKQPSLKQIFKESEKNSESQQSSTLTEPEAEDSLSNYTMYSQISRISKATSKQSRQPVHKKETKSQLNTIQTQKFAEKSELDRKFKTLQQKIRKQTYQTVYRNGIAADARSFDKNRTILAETMVSAALNKQRN